MRRSIPLFALLALPGCADWASPFRAMTEAPPELKYASRADVGMGAECLPIDVVYTVHPDIRFAAADEEARLRAVTRNVLAEAFRSAVEAPPGSHARLEDARRSLPARAEGQVPALGAKALVLVDFRPPLPGRPDLASQLLVQVHDISFARYEELTLFSPRLLVFEDFAEVPAPRRPSEMAGAFLLAWKEVLVRMRSSDRFRRYLALGREPVDASRSDGALLLGIVPPDRVARTPDPRGHAWVEENFLFPPAGEAAPGEPAGGGK